MVQSWFPDEVVKTARGKDEMLQESEALRSERKKLRTGAGMACGI